MARTNTAEIDSAQGTIAVSTQARLEQYGAMLTSIPLREVDPDSLLLDIVGATDWQDWEKDAEKLPSLSRYIGRTLKVVQIERGESELDPANPYFLFLHCVTDLGEPFLVTTGSRSVVARLVMLHHWGKLPAVIEPVEVGKAKAGQSRALDLKVLAVGGGH